MLFLSHSSSDKPRVRRLAVDLLLEGWPVWFDELENEPGDALRARISAEIAASDYFVILLSKASVRSDWVKDELATALRIERDMGRTFLLPIKLDACEVPSELADRLIADFS